MLYKRWIHASDISERNEPGVALSARQRGAAPRCQAHLSEYASILQWRPDGQDSLLDVGSGPGNVLMDFVHPLLPKSFEQLVGTDVSMQMVRYANKCYERYARTQFQVLDIGCEELPEQLRGRFDHVTSFYCLHWVQNLRAALRNIYNLLRDEGGDTLLVFLATNPIYEVYKVLKNDAKWTSYMQDVDQFISPLHYSTDPVKQFEELLNESGFVYRNVELRSEVFVYEGVQTLKDNVKAICPFLERIPKSQHDEFLNDFVDIVISMNLKQETKSNAEHSLERFISPYKLIVAYARKSPKFLQNVFSDLPSVKNVKGVM